MFARFAKRLQAYRTRQQTVSLLARMEDYQLRDIGVERGEIDILVRRGRTAA